MIEFSVKQHWFGMVVYYREVKRDPTNQKWVESHPFTKVTIRELPELMKRLSQPGTGTQPLEDQKDKD